MVATPSWGVITYVDAVPNTNGSDGNTTFDGTLITLFDSALDGTGNVTTDFNATDSLWRYRRSTQSNCETAWESHETENTKPLVTTLSLPPGIYKLYGLFWSGSSGNFIVQFRTGKTGPFKYFDSSDRSSVQATANGSEFKNSVIVRSPSGFGDLRIANLGEHAITDSLEIYVNSPSAQLFGDPRTVYDGVGYELVRPLTEPKSAAVRILQSGDRGFGWQWVQQHPFTIQAASVNPKTWDFIKYVDAGFTVLQWDPGNPNSVSSRPKPYQNMSWHGYGGSPTLPGQTGWIVVDEPTRLAMPGIAYAVATLRRQSSERQKLMYGTAVNYSTNAANLFGGEGRPNYTYSQYLDDFVRIIKPDVLMFDNYPFFSNGTTWSAYLENLMMVRTKAMANNMPYWGWLQAYGSYGRRMPSESDNRYNVYTHLTMGFTGFSYWTFDQSSLEDKGTGDGLLDSNGKPTPLYKFVKQTNSEIANLGRSLRFLTSTDVRFLPGKDSESGNLHSPPSGLANWSVNAGGDPYVLSATVNFSQEESYGSDKDGLIGFFTDNDHQHYFMLTNLYHGGKLSADAATLSFKVVFNDQVNSLWKMNRVTGCIEEVPLTNHTLISKLPGGTSDLFKFGDSNFKGMPLGTDQSKVQSSR